MFNTSLSIEDRGIQAPYMGTGELVCLSGARGTFTMKLEPEHGPVLFHGHCDGALYRTGD